MELTEEHLELKRNFEKRIYELLPKASVKIDSKNYLSITINMPIDVLKSLRADLLELEELGMSPKIKCSLSKVQFKNYKGGYEIADLEEPFYIEVILTSDNFQVNKKISWADKNGIYQESIVNNFRISVFIESIEKKTIIKIGK